MNSSQKPVTTSLKVAQYFGKNHHDVLKAIKNLDCSRGFNDSNFAGISYTDRRGRPQPAYEMTRDGFMFLVMGFNGKEAARMKEAFIEAFNMMEDKLRNPIARLPMQKQLELYMEEYRLEKEKREALEAEVVELGTR